MEKYQVYYYYKYNHVDYTSLYWSFTGLAAIFVAAVTIPCYMHYKAGENLELRRDSNENYVQWHLETEIALIKTKTKKKRRKNKNGTLSTEEI
ncbi:unnamed protein product [Caenorhabditis sp. 36 PRJEB53466]|nr:unnamed protein product [Caenorhabditis sp. 36 PRJEB53466]